MTVAPSSGDILISRRPGASVYEISRIPGPAQLVSANYSTAVTRASEVAKHECVDVWYSEHSTGFRCVAQYRVPES